MPDETKRRVTRLNRWVLILTVFVLAGAVAAPIIGGAIVDSKNAETQLVVSCTSARASAAELKALRRFSREIGVPWTFPIPEVPPECDGF